MELRKKEEAREIETKQISLRQVGTAATIRQYRKNPKRRTGKRLKAENRERRDRSFSGPLKISLTRAQQKKWNSYSMARREQILKNAVHVADKKGRFFVTGGTTEAHRTGKPEAKQSWQTQSKKKYNLKADTARMRVQQAAPVLKQRAISGQQAASLGSLTARKKNPVSKHKNTEVQKRQKSIPSIQDFRRTRQKERKQKKEQKRWNKAYAWNVITTLNNDVRRQEWIKERQLQSQVDIYAEEQQSQAERSAIRIAALPVRIKMRVIRMQMTAAMLQMATAAFKYVAVLAVPLLTAGIVLLFAISLLSGVAGEADSRAEQSVSGYEIVAYAKEWIGITKYVWGAGRDSATAWQSYADCSAFAHGVFAHFGYEIGSTTYEQESAGTEVDLEDALPGDLVLFYSGTIAPGNSSHAAIYAGDGQIVHCAGGPENNSIANAGPGVCMGTLAGDGRPYVIRRIVINTSFASETLMAILSGYNKRLQADRKKGIRWYYLNGQGKATFLETCNSDKKVSDCARLICWALKEIGVLKRNSSFWGEPGYIHWKNGAEESIRQYCDVIEIKNKTARQLIASGELRSGDICTYMDYGHTNVYAGNRQWFDAGHSGANGHYEGSTYYFDNWGPVETIHMDAKIGYIIRFKDQNNGSGGSGYGRDFTPYTKSQMELIWAIVAQEDNGSYAGALAVISSAMNRVESANWSYCGSNSLQQLTAPGQYCYSIDTYWQARLNGNVPAYVKQAVSDCLQKGIRNHSFTSFRSTKGSQTGANAVQIGGNWYFGN